MADWNEAMKNEMPTAEDEALEAIYWDEVDKDQLIGRINELHAEVHRKRTLVSTVEAERDNALKRADFAESVARRAAADAHKAIREMHEAQRHLRQLLHALDKMRETNGEEYISVNVAIAMLEARRYLQTPAGREE